MSHSDKPMVAINADYRGPRKETPAFSFLAAGYFDAISRAGGIPVILPPLSEDVRPLDDDALEPDLHRLLDHFDALLFIGGPDLDPRRDGFMLHSSVRLMEPRREIFDRRLMRMAWERRIPVFGIGAGMQLLNVTLGGTLFLDIAEDLPDALRHYDPHDPGHRHSLQVERQSIMERIYGDSEIRVSSMHHMAVDDLGDGLRVTARCPDGVVEAVEYAGTDWFAMGTQFHPESDTASAVDIRVFEEFLQGATAFRQAMRRVVGAAA